MEESCEIETNLVKNVELYVRTLFFYNKINGIDRKLINIVALSPQFIRRS